MRWQHRIAAELARWTPANDNNPSGRPPLTPAEIIEAAQEALDTCPPGSKQAEVCAAELRAAIEALTHQP